MLQVFSTVPRLLLALAGHQSPLVHRREDPVLQALARRVQDVAVRVRPKVYDDGDDKDGL